jgi:hypothetical protein
MTNVLIITHHFGGGTDVYIDNVIRCTPDCKFHIIKKDGEFPSVDYMQINFLRSYEEGMIDRIMGLGVPYIITLHDYSFIFKQYFITIDDVVSTKSTYYSKLYSNLFNRAVAVIAPSKSTMEIYKKYFPNACIKYLYHEDIQFMHRYVVPTIHNRFMKVAIIGCIAPHKGAEILVAIIRYCRRYNIALTFKVFGSVPNNEYIDQTGVYETEEDLFREIRLYMPDIIWFPNRTLETYSYVLTSAMKTGLPLLLPKTDIFVERTEQYRHTYFVDAAQTARKVVKKLLRLKKMYSKNKAKGELKFDCITATHKSVYHSLALIKVVTKYPPDITPNTSAIPAPNSYPELETPFSATVSGSVP